MTRRRAAAGLVATAVVLWLVALGLPAYHLTGGSSYGGLGAALWGPLGWFSVMEWGEQPHKIAYLAWLANPLAAAAAGCVLLGLARTARVLGGAAVPVAGLAVLLESVLVDEGGGRLAVVGMGSGFALWFTAIAVVAAASWVVPGGAAEQRRG